MAYSMISDSCIVPWSSGGTVVELVCVPDGECSVVGVAVLSVLEGWDVGDTATEVAEYLVLGEVGVEYTCRVMEDRSVGAKKSTLDVSPLRAWDVEGTGLGMTAAQRTVELLRALFRGQIMGK